MTEKTYYMLQTAEDVDGLITDEQLDAALDWFEDEPKLPTSDFLDRLFPRYSGPPGPDGYDECDLDQMDNEAARRIMARARKLRREREL